MEHNHKHHEHEVEHNHEHGHNHGSSKLPLTLYITGLILFVLGILVSDELIKTILYLNGLVLTGYHIVFEGIEDTIVNTKKLKRFSPNVHILMMFAAIGAVIIGDYYEATLLLIIFAGAHFLEEYAEGRSKREITNLLKFNPTTARRINRDGTIEVVDVDDLEFGDELQVLNGDQIATDGVISSGYGVVNEASITGESMPKEKKTGDLVFGSTINGEGTFTMTVTKDSDDTVFAKILKVVSQAQTNVSKTAAFIKRIEPIYVTLIILMAPVFFLLAYFVFNWGYDVSFYRIMVFLIVASPCALAVTDVPATLSAISQLARGGVLFKGGSYLANLADVSAIAFDKTGTLTKGEPTITDVYYLDDTNVNNQLYLDIIVGMERKSNHPLAKAIVESIKINQMINIDADNKIGSGIVGSFNNRNYSILKPSAIEVLDQGVQGVVDKYQEQGKTVVVFSEDHVVRIIIALQDIANSNVKEVIDYFNRQNVQTIMLTGDALLTGKFIADEIGIKEVKANILPEEKSKALEKIKTSYGVVAVVGDGVNDAPALVTADIGIAMGDGTDIAIDSADGVIMKNDLSKLITMHKVSKKLKSVVIQNIIFSLLIVIFLITMNFIGMMNMPYAVAIHEGSTLVVILSGLRLLIKVRE